MEIRTAQPEDLPALMRMAQDFHAASPAVETVQFCPRSMAETFQSLATGDRSILFVADDEELGVIGMIAGVFYPHYLNAMHIAAQELFWWCDPSARGKGAGLALIKAMEDWAKDIGAKTLYMASTSNPNAEKLAKLYQRRGFSKHDIYFAKRI